MKNLQQQTSSRQKATESENRPNFRLDSAQQYKKRTQEALKENVLEQSPTGTVKGHDNHDTINSGRAKSPLQCAEMVFGPFEKSGVAFGNLTNMELSRQNSQSSQGEPCENKNELAFDLRQKKSVSKSHNYSQLMTFQLLHKTASQKLPKDFSAFHCRSKTMPEFQKIEEYSAYNEDQESAISQLRQQNMIIEAEKTNMQAELIFYKNELAKLCLKTGTRFPAFRSPDIDSTIARRQQNFTSTEQSNSQKNFHITNPQSLKGKQKLSTPSEFRYINVSQGGVDDQVSTTLSHVIQSKSTNCLKKRPTNDQKKRFVTNTSQYSQNIPYLDAEESQILIQSPPELWMPKEANKESSRRSSLNDSDNFHAKKAFSIQHVTVNLPQRQCTILSCAKKSEDSVTSVQSGSRRKRSERTARHISRQSQQSSKEEQPSSSQIGLELLDGGDEEGKDSISMTILDLDKSSYPTNHMPSTSALSSRDVLRASQSDLRPYVDLSSMTPSYVPSRICFTRVETQEELPQKSQYSDVARLNPGAVVETHHVTEICSFSDESVNVDHKDLQAYQTHPPVILSPLLKKEQILESSHKELQEKLAKVREDIRELQEMPRSPTSPQFVDLTVTIKKEEKEQVSGFTKIIVLSFEKELQQLRQQLESYKQEEKKVLRELEATKTLLKAQDTDQESQLSQTSERSLPLYPVRLNFDNSSQKSFGNFLSPKEQSAGFKKFQQDMTVESHCCPNSLESQQCLTESDNLSYCSTQQHAAPINKETNKENIKIIEYEEAELAEPIDFCIKNSDSNKKGAYQTTAGFVHQTNWFSQIIEEEHESESIENSASRYSRCGSNLQNPNLSTDQQNNELMHDYREFVNDAKNTCKMNQQLQKVSERSSREPSAYENTSKQMITLSLTCMEHRDIQLFNDLPFSDTSMEKSSINSPNKINIELQKEAQRSQKTSYDINSQKSAQHNIQSINLKTSTLQNFQKLIQNTQQSDEDSLLRHIQKNLEQLKTSSDYSTRFALLQQQQSPSPPVSHRNLFPGSQSIQQTLDKKYLESTNEVNCSFDTHQFIQDSEHQDPDRLCQSKETNGDRNNQEMSESTQFFAGGQTGTSYPIVSNRSSVDQTTHKIYAEESKIEFPSQRQKSRNSLKISNSTKSLSSMAECQIRILQNPKAAETMSSGLQNQISSTNSIELLSKAQPYFQEHSTFEKTKNWEEKNGTFNGLIGEGLISIFQQSNSLEDVGKSSRDRDVRFLQKIKQHVNLDSKFDLQKQISLANSQKNREQNKKYPIPSSVRNLFASVKEEEPSSQSIGGQLKKSCSAQQSTLFDKTSSSEQQIIDIASQQVTFCVTKNDPVSNEQTNQFFLQKSTEKIHKQHISSYRDNQNMNSKLDGQSTTRGAPANCFPTFFSNYTDRSQLQSQAGVIFPYWPERVEPSPKKRSHLSNSQLNNNLNSKTDQKDLKSSHLIRKSGSQKVIDTIPCNQPYPNATQPSVYGHRRASAFSSSSKTQLMKPVRQQQSELATESSGVKTETRSCYNIYKRNSVKIGKNQEGLDLKKGNLIKNNESNSPLQRAHLLNLEISDTMMHHAASQSTLNLEARSPFSQVKTPNSVMVKINKSIEATSPGVPLARQVQVSGFAGNAKNVGAATAPRKYEVLYQEYINGKCEDETLLVSQKSEQVFSRNKKMSDPGKKSAGELGKSQMSAKRIVKTKSLSCLSTQGLARPATNLFKRNQETVKSVLTTTKNTTNQTSVYNSSRTQTAFQASVSDRNLPTNQSKTNSDKQNSAQFFPPSKYLTRFSGGINKTPAPSIQYNDSTNIVLFSEAKPRSTPSYMQPIQQFKKQTNRKVQEKEAC